jgi:hypothetical protein
LILLIAGVIVVTRLHSKTIYNDDNVHGNTTGNLNNDGTFCEFNGRIYFSNPADSDCLYSMNPDCTNITKLNNDSVQSINVGGNYIYYLRNNVASQNVGAIFQNKKYGIIRTDLNGKNALTLYDFAAGVVNLCGNYVYYQHYSNDDAFSFYRVKIDGTEETRISDNGYFPACTYGTSIYYVNVEGNHFIYRYDTKTGRSTTYMEANAYLIDMQGDYLYYIDLDRNYSLVRVDTSTMKKELLTNPSDGKCITYNVYGNKIFYYLEGENSALYRMNTDTSDNTLIYSGTVSTINCTSEYTFFRLFQSDTLFRVSTDGVPIAEQIILQ